MTLTKSNNKIQHFTFFYQNDLNHYCSLSAIKYYAILYRAQGIFILYHDIVETGRFSGVLCAEDAYEFCQKREDWMIIKKEVDKVESGRTI